MKNIIKIILVGLLCFPLISKTQNKELKDFFDKYHKQDHVTSVSISLDAFQVHLADDSEDEEVNDLMEQVDKIKILHFENQYRTFRDSDFSDEFKEIIDGGDFKLLVDIISDGEMVKVYIVKGEDNVISEGLIVTQDDDEASLIWVSGEMDLDDFMHSHRLFRHFH
jgi:hypothetical protein